MAVASRPVPFRSSLTGEQTAAIHAAADEAARHLTYRDSTVVRVDPGPGLEVEVAMIRVLPETTIGFPGLSETAPEDRLSMTTLLVSAFGIEPAKYWDPLDASSSLPVTSLVGRRARTLQVFYTRFAVTFGAEQARPDDAFG